MTLPRIQPRLNATMIDSFDERSRLRLTSRGSATILSLTMQRVYLTVEVKTPTTSTLPSVTSASAIASSWVKRWACHFVGDQYRPAA